LRHVVRVASPVVAERVSARVAATGRGTERAPSPVTCRARICEQRCESAVEPRRVSSAEHDDDDRAGNDDDHRATDHDDDAATTAGHDDDHRAATAATTDHDDDHRAAAARADGQ
jgi:hypothetical protein